MANTPLCEQLVGTRGFSDKSMIPPPSERGNNVIQFELTTGCSHGRCTFCDMYDQSSYGEKSIDDFERHVNQVLDFITKYKRVSVFNHIESRVFIGAGDALGVDNEKFIEACEIIKKTFSKRKQTFFRPDRLAVYGSVKNILKKDENYMNRFREIDGFIDKVVYVGLESGSDQVLKVVNKGNTQDEAVKAGIILRQTGILNSTMIMPGLGGEAYSKEHIRETARVLNETKPKWVTFMGLTVKKGTPYETWIKKQEQLSQNRNLTPYETVEQTAQIIERLNFKTQIGIYGYDVHEGFCSNPINISPQRIYDKSDASGVANALRILLHHSNLDTRSIPKKVFDFFVSQ